jgi:hypothetical protein
MLFHLNLLFDVIVMTLRQNLQIKTAGAANTFPSVLTASGPHML